MMHAALRSSNQRRTQNQESKQRGTRPDSGYSAKRSANLAAPIALEPRAFGQIV